MKTTKNRPVKFSLTVAQNQLKPSQLSPRSIQGARGQSAVCGLRSVVRAGRCRSYLNHIGSSLVVLATLAAIVLAGCSSGNVQPRTFSNYHSQSRVGSRGRSWTRGEPPLSSRIVASWYGPGYKGRRTANGEDFDPRGFTAASKTLPMGSIVRVTNLQNGRWVNVRINDRGPVAPGRSIDLSTAAAQSIGLAKSGVARVKVTRISD
jgi:rare lipoprotein A (peptidoglycan hydrolase)